MFSFFPWEEIGAGNADSIYFYDKGECLTIGEQERITRVAKGAVSVYVLWMKVAKNEVFLFVFFLRSEWERN